MSTWLDDIGLDRIAGGGFDWTGIGLPQWTEAPWTRLSARISRTKLLIVPLALLAAAGAWLIMTGSRGGSAVSGPAGSSTLAAVSVLPPAEPAPREVAYDPFTSEAVAPEQSTPLDRLKLSALSFHRGGLGSNAQVSFTLRNGNDYAVKDVAIACAFTRRDGRHLTDRTRLVPGTVEMHSRKSFPRLHIGFVNLNANKAKCALVSAAKT